MKASLDAVSVSVFPIRRTFNWLYPLWVLWKIFCIKKRFNVAILYSTYQPLNIITAYVAKNIFKLYWVLDLWDDPEKSLLIIKNFPEMGSFFLKLRLFVEFFLAKRSIKCVDKVIIALVRSIIQNKYSIPSHKILSITNGINLDYDFNQSVDKEDNTFTLFYCGTVDKIRLEGLLPCLSEVIKEIPILKIIIIGREFNDGYKWIKNEFKNSKKYIKLDIKGIQPYRSVVEAVGESDICLCPYPDKIDIAQTYPVKLFDYMVIGKPIVASSLPGIKKIITDGYNGVLFSPGDYQEMARHIIALYHSPKTRKHISKNAKISVLDFNYDSIHEKIFLFLRSSDLISEFGCN